MGARRGGLRPLSETEVSSPTSPISAARPRPNRERSAIAAAPERAIMLSFQFHGRHLPPNELPGFQRLFTLNDLCGQPQIGFTANAFEIVDKYRLPVGRCLRYSNVARNYGLVRFVAHTLTN